MTMTHKTPPTVEDALAFRDKINEGREILGLPPVEKFDFDDCTSSDPRSCLSARHLFNADGMGEALTRHFSRSPLDDPLALAWSEVIPEEIRRITDPFDRIDMRNTQAARESARADLRGVLVEAGIVEP